MGGVSIHETQARILGARLEDLAGKMSPQNPGAVEFHASEIFGRRVAPWKGMKKEQAIAVIKSVLRVAAESRLLRVFACAVAKESTDRDPAEVAFEDLCSRFDQYLARLRLQNDDQRGMLALDKSAKETALQKLSRDFQRIGTQWGAVQNIADVPFFVDSRASRLVQLADHVAYAVFRLYNAEDANYFNVIAPKFHGSEDGSFHGLGHKCKSQAACACPACIRRRRGGAD